MNHRLVVLCALLLTPGCMASVGSLDEGEGNDPLALGSGDCYPSGNHFNCRPPDGDPGYAPRVYNPVTRSEWWPIASGAHLRDGTGTVRGIVATDQVRINLGMRKSLAGATHVYAWTVELDSGVYASGWVREDALRDASVLRARMSTLRLPDPGAGEYETDWVITGGDVARFHQLKVTSGFAGDGRQATDYLTREGDVVNLIYNTPGRGLGGYSVDTFPLGAHFHRSRGVDQIDVPVYVPGHTTATDALHFVYGFVYDGSERRYGWLAHEALSEAGAGATPDPTPTPSDPTPMPADPTPTPADPTPTPAATCSARCCDGTVVTDLVAGDGAQCTSASSPVCEAHGYVLRARLNDTVVYERDSFCWALCAGRTAYHRVDGVTSGCTEQAAAYCNVGDRGGLRDALWSQCDPN